MSKFIDPNGREYPITLAEVTNREAKLLQEVTGVPYHRLVSELALHGPDGMAAVYWLAMRKCDHHVEFAALEFPMGRLHFVMEEPDPTKGSDATPAPAKSSSPRSTRSTKPRGPRSSPS